MEGLCYTHGMKIYIDADGIPWRDVVIEQGKRHGVEVVMVADYSHLLVGGEGVEVVMVDGGKDAADLAILNRVQAGDLVVTEDLGLASLSLPKGAEVISPRGFQFREEGIDRGLVRRWKAKRVRRGGGRLKGPRPLTSEERERFQRLLEGRLIALTRRRHEDRSVPE